MTVGFSATQLLNGWLNVLRGTTFTGITAVYVKLHTGDPGVGAGNAAVGSTTRPAITWAAASGGSIAMTGTAPSWTNGGTSETITHISFWDAATAGNFLFSAALGTGKAWASTDTLTLTTQTVAVTPVAA